MNTLESELDSITVMLGKLYGLPSGVLLLFACLIIGYILRCIGSFPNKGIPVVVTLCGGLFFPLLATFDGKTPLRIWVIRNVFIGLIIGFISWITHNKFLSKIKPIENWVDNLAAQPPPPTPPNP